MERKARKAGLTDNRIRKEKSDAVIKNVLFHGLIGTSHADPADQYAVTRVLNGRSTLGPDGAFHLGRQLNGMAYTERGDFTNCFRRGI